jgi:hypothetical protein
MRTIVLSNLNGPDFGVSPSGKIVHIFILPSVTPYMTRNVTNPVEPGVGDLVAKTGELRYFLCRDFHACEAYPFRIDQIWYTLTQQLLSILSLTR